MVNAPDGDPLIWLNERWTKLIETVQTLATKYGQEHKENIVGTISSVEARDVLIKNKGSVWHAVSQCIEQRQQAFNTIKSKGNYSRDDIVSSITAHNGNVEMALAELNRLQMKPFLLKIQGSPATDQQPSSSSQRERNSIASKESEETLKENDSQANDDKRDILRDIEAIIGSMEEKQSKQTETLISTIENIVGNMIMTHTSRSISSASSFSNLDQNDRFDRMHIKSPIVIPKIADEFDSSADVETDVKHFVSRHIQDVVPDVAVLLSKELTSEQNGESERIKQEIQFENLTEKAVATNVFNEPTVMAIQTEETALNHLKTFDETLRTEEIQSNVPRNDESPDAPIQHDLTSLHENASAPNDSLLASEVSASSLQNAILSPKVENHVQKLGAMQQSSRNKPRYVVTKSSIRLTQKQIDKRRIRDLEKQLRRQQKDQRRNSINTDRSESQNTSYLSDSTVVADETRDIDSLLGVSDEETFSLSIVEQAVRIDDNKDNNQTIASPVVRSPDFMNQPSSSGISRPADEVNSASKIESNANSGDGIELTKDAKHRNLSELVEDTKSLIQQMKNEIDEDIAMSASEFDGGENDGYLSDELIYSEEMDGRESEFSDSWEDISDESVVGGYEVDYEHYDEDDNVKFQRSSQSVESEFFVSLESPTSENEYVNEENFTVFDNIDIVDGYRASDSSAINENHDEQNLKYETPDKNDEITIKSTQNEEIDSANRNTITTSSSSLKMSIAGSPVDNNLIEHILEIQQSLHTSSIVSVNFREAALREKSQSVEPSNESHMSTPIHSPDQPKTIVENSFQSTEEQAISVEPIREQENGVEATRDEENSSRPIVEPNHREMLQEEQHVLQQNSTQETIEQQIDESLVDQGEHASQLAGQSRTSSNDTEGKIAEQSEPLKNGSIPAAVYHEASESESQLHSLSHLKSISNSENQASHANDTESEMDDLSVDVSTDSSSSNDNIGLRSSLSTASVASEKLVESYQYKKLTVPVVTECSSSSINVMQLKKTNLEKTTVKNKIPVRRPSFAEPSASIRNIQNELLNKQLKQPPKIVSKKPSKIVPPKLFFKSNPDANKPRPRKASKPEPEPKPSTSRERPSIPKKKYYETCFSDDNYQTSDDENPITSKTVIPNLVHIAESITEEDVEVIISMNWLNSQLFIILEKSLMYSRQWHKDY